MLSVKNLGVFAIVALLAVHGAMGQEAKITKEEWEKTCLLFKGTYAAATDTPTKVAAVKILEPGLGNLQDASGEFTAFGLLFEIVVSNADEAVIDSAIDCLSRISYSRAIDFMAKRAVSIDASPLRLKLARLFGKMCYDEFAEPLALFAQDKDIEVVAAAFEALAMLSSDEAIDIVNKAVGNKNPKIKAAALEAVKKSGDHRFTAALIKLLKSEKEAAAKQSVLELLQALTGQDFGLDVAKWTEWFQKNWKNPVARVNQKAVDTAIEKGTKWLISQNPIPGGAAELVAYAYIHGGVKPDDPAMKAAIEYLETAPLATTYRTALIAMALHDLDKIKYRKRLAECAYFLMGNQDPKGYWRYGAPVEGFEPPDIPTESAKPIDTGANNDDPKEKTGTGKGKKGGGTDLDKDKIKIKLPPRRNFTDWDNSNSQYAILGLRACADGGILIPVEVWRDAEQHFAECQSRDGGWSYQKGVSYGSMSAGGASSIALCKYYQGKPWKNAPEVQRGIDWLTKNFTVVENARFSVAKRFHYYYLYAIERAGILADTERFGNHEWYPIGAKYLLANQDQNTGAWNNNVIDTCFAILFLRRATESIPKPKEKPKDIETGGARGDEKK